ncbi:MAG: thioesterase family protein [Hydrogenophaga sp.]|jgi:acyl-CoA thioesterase FadM|uniref:thioesterase family protein n=1 Tax=Hydrogenophaga sp. TaxID=1904254 RepID=UPI00260FD33B|nr:thioesterase family protein [Hydrogenophaga sp.]MCW5669409.1 thioesterase family protein [Hydrogenophaga sp.]
MIGLARNLGTLVRAAFTRGECTPQSRLSCRFRVTPFDVGLRVLKSDRYLQLAEAAQLDFMVRTRLAVPLVRAGIGFVNASQLIRFARPIGLFQRVDVQTAIVFADDRCAYFAHTLLVRGVLHAEVLVKMKFKQGRLTVPPRDVLGDCPAEKPAHLVAWDQSLAGR